MVDPGERVAHRRGRLVTGSRVARQAVMHEVVESSRDVVARGPDRGCRVLSRVVPRYPTLYPPAFHGRTHEPFSERRAAADRDDLSLGTNMRVVPGLDTLLRAP